MSIDLRSLAPAAALVIACPAVAADNGIDALVGNFDLAASTTVPAGNWGYSKGRISITGLDDRHALIVLACEWKREPKAVCGEHYLVQQRDEGVYLQDLNTDFVRLYFDPASRKLTMIYRAADAKESVRRDLFTPTSAPLEDPALARRMKREQGNAAHKENLRVFGHYSKRAFLNNRIEFQNIP